MVVMSGMVPRGVERMVFEPVLGRWKRVGPVVSEGKVVLERRNSECKVLILVARRPESP